MAWISETDLISGIFSCILIAIFLFVGLKIILKYFEVKQRVFLLVGITWIGLSAPWWGSALSFIVGLTNDGLGLYGSVEGERIYFLVGNFFVPIVLIIWFIAFTDLLYKEKQKLIVLLSIIYGMVFYLAFFILLFSEPDTMHATIGYLESATDSTYKSVVLLWLVSLIVIILITGTLFARESIRSDNPEIKLKGKLLRLAFILFCIGGALDAGLPQSPITLPITRIVIMLSAFFFYGGFLLPDWMKKMFLKEGR